MLLLIAAICAYIFLLLLAWGLCRIAGLSDEALEREFGPRRIPPKGW